MRIYFLGLMALSTPARLDSIVQVDAEIHVSVHAPEPESAEMRRATITMHHGPDHPSRILLPVVP